MRRFRTQEKPRQFRAHPKTVTTPISLSARRVESGPFCPYLCPQDGEVKAIRIIVDQLSGKDLPLFFVCKSGPLVTRVQVKLTPKEKSCVVTGESIRVSAGDLLYLEAPDYLPDSVNDFVEGVFVAFLFVTTGG